MTSPSDYANRIVQLSARGVIGPLTADEADALACCGPDTVPSDWAATRILESCLWETLRAFARKDRKYTISCGPDGYSVVSLFASFPTLLEAADAVIAHLEAK